ncbi:MAG: hypothetical protein QY310_11660 [Candidatus Jettenia sp. CY-1]|nr:MAG: hypothetical protein QY310_11660 [Candidatus Jettenia sp. CY-1]
MGEYNQKSSVEIVRAILEDKSIPTHVAYQYPETRKLFNKKYRESKVPAKGELFKKIGVEKGHVFADYIRLQEKHPEYFATPKDVKNTCRICC